TQLRHLGTGVSLVLLFIGLKMLTGHWVVISSAISLAVIAFLLVAATVASLMDKRAPVTADAKSANLERKR
ncbi:MAG: TerC family protein, partial [Candidatus Acidiferrales bacterium]